MPEFWPWRAAGPLKADLSHPVLNCRRRVELRYHGPEREDRDDNEEMYQVFSVVARSAYGRTAVCVCPGRSCTGAAGCRTGADFQPGGTGPDAGAHSALSGLVAHTGAHGFHLPNGSRCGGSLAQCKQELEGGPVCRCPGAATLGPERKIAR